MTASRSNWTGVAFGLCIACFAAYQQFKLPPALPLLLQSYGYDRTLAGGFMSVYALAGLGLSLFLGRIIDRGHAGVSILIGLAAMIAGSSLALALPENGWIVLAARALEGAGFAVLAMCGPVLANANAAPRHLPIIVGLTAAWIPVGQLAAALLAPAAFAVQGWQALWLVAILGSAALAVWTLSLMRRGALELSAGARAAAGTKAASLPAGRRLSLILTAVIFMLWSGQYFAYMTWLPQYLVEVHGLTPSLAVVGNMVPVVVLILTTLVTGMILRAGVPLGPLLVAGLAVQAAGWWAVSSAAGGWIGIASLVVYGIAAGICPTCFFAMPSALAGQGRAAGPAFGIIMTGRNLGVLVGPVLLAQAFKITGAWDIAAPIFGTITALALVLGLWLAVSLRGARYKY
ncbi:MAG: MFS transporter [Kiloniellales bacterium]|jgi:MFS family permease